jgi:hypothetical protein
MQAQQFGQGKEFRVLEPITFDKAPAGGFAFLFRVDGKTRHLKIVHVAVSGTKRDVAFFGDLGVGQTAFAHLQPPQYPPLTFSRLYRNQSLPSPRIPFYLMVIG